MWPWVTGGAFFHNSIVVFVAQLALALAMAVASILHFAIEQPFLRLKNRFHDKRRSKLRVSPTATPENCLGATGKKPVLARKD